MDDLHKHINESLTDPAFADAWAESEIVYQITKQIIALRLHQGLTQKEVAVRLGTTQTAIARIESGEQNLTIKMLKKLADVLNANVKIDLQPR